MSARHLQRLNVPIELFGKATVTYRQLAGAKTRRPADLSIAVMPLFHNRQYYTRGKSQVVIVASISPATPTSKQVAIIIFHTLAISSLKKYPLPLASGKDCKILENFGDKICKMLDERLATYSADTGDVSPEWEDLPDLPAPNDPTTSGTEGTGRAPQHTQRRRRQSSELAGGNRPYVPQLRSGAYALLLTLYNDKQKADSCGFMSKQELMKEAQPLADKSFRRPDPGSHYTAWSSMGTLMVKGFITRASCPAKYIITESGCELAARLAHAQHDVSPAREDADCQLVQPQPTRAVGNTESDDVVVIEDIPLMQRLGRKKQTSQKTKSATRDIPVAESVDGCSTIGRTVTTIKQSTATSDSDRRKAKTTTAANKRLAVSSGGGNTIDRTASTTVSDSRVLDEVSRKRLCTEACGVANTASSTVKASLTFDEMKWKLSATSSSSCSATCNQEALWEMAAYSYDIILCVDNCELSARDSAGRDVLLKELEKNNVAFVVRKLQVGDFLWVAKDTTGRYGGTELMLDYIVERKRMDDLSGSIIDGRFHEQKFRLRNSGVKNVIYLIEKYGSNQHLSIAEDTLNQAIINTQVIDGFHIKHTASTRESAAYLTLMTRYLQSFYGGKALSCGSSNKDGQLVTFQDFNDSTVKTKAMTVTEMFAKQLLQLHGMTGEKALAVTQTYPTPAGLLEAYSSNQSKKQKEELLAAICCGPLHRPLGVPLSKTLYMLYSTETALR
ncbi:Crossover junction endonuclease MUS81 [Lamellibrachia satsuma]|nr:Crossover junction endonuclease MUS81 [Lamellibrachia satsuma]